MAHKRYLNPDEKADMMELFEKIFAFSLEEVNKVVPEDPANTLININAHMISTILTNASEDDKEFIRNSVEFLSNAILEKCGVENV